MITQLARVCRSAPELPKAEHFYCTALGLKKLFRFIRNGAEFGFSLDLGGKTFIEVFAKPVDAADRPPIRQLCLQVTGRDCVLS